MEIIQITTFRVLFFDFSIFRFKLIKILLTEILSESFFVCNVVKKVQLFFFDNNGRPLLAVFVYAMIFYPLWVQPSGFMLYCSTTSKILYIATEMMYRQQYVQNYYHIIIILNVFEQQTNILFNVIFTAYFFNINRYCGQTYLRVPISQYLYFIHT